MADTKPVTQEVNGTVILPAFSIPCRKSFFTEASIFLIGGNNGLTDIDVLNFGGQTKVPAFPEFPAFPAFPHPVSQAVGAFFNNELLVCGGFDYPVTFYKDCYAIRDQYDKTFCLTSFFRYDKLACLSTFEMFDARGLLY
jgi:hypothetical protein